MGRTINRVYVPYWMWEDYQAGMWKKSQDEELLNRAIEFTGDHIRYGEAMSEVVIKWPHTTLNSLTNQSINQKAFVGHCAVQYRLGIPENITRMAWKELSSEQQIKANKVAEQAIKKWIKAYITIWENRCYPDGLPDEAPEDIKHLVPAYKKLVLSILTNNYKEIRQDKPRSRYYRILKQQELRERGVIRQLKLFADNLFANNRQNN